MHNKIAQTGGIVIFSQKIDSGKNHGSVHEVKRSR